MSRSLIFMLLAAGGLTAGEITPDKSRYTLFNPTPRELLRELSTDRPDITESPYTVDAGHLQIEMDVVAYTRDRHTPERDGGFESWSFANTNLKLGLTNWADLQLVVPAHQSVRRGPSGFGDLTVRLKMNIWGNDSGGTALGIMPFLKVPTADEGLGNDEVEGGIIIPFAAALPNEWSFGAMLEIDFLADDDGRGRKTDFVGSITFSRPIAGELGGYVEFVGVAGVETDWAATFNTGFTYGLSPDVQLDAGVNIGLTRSAEDVTTFFGVSYRF